MRGNRLAGLVTLVAGIAAGLFSALTISNETTPRGLFSIQEYYYTPPFTSHEVFMIFLSVASGLAIVIGIVLLVRKGPGDSKTVVSKESEPEKAATEVQKPVTNSLSAIRSIQQAANRFIAYDDQLLRDYSTTLQVLKGATDFKSILQAKPTVGEYQYIASIKADDSVQKKELALNAYHTLTEYRSNVELNLSNLIWTLATGDLENMGYSLDNSVKKERARLLFIFYCRRKDLKNANERAELYLPRALADFAALLIQGEVFAKNDRFAHEVLTVLGTEYGIDVSDILSHFQKLENGLYQYRE